MRRSPVEPDEILSSAASIALPAPKTAESDSGNSILTNLSPCPLEDCFLTPTLSSETSSKSHSKSPKAPKTPAANMSGKVLTGPPGLLGSTTSTSSSNDGIPTSELADPSSNGTPSSTPAASQSESPMNPSEAGNLATAQSSGGLLASTATASPSASSQTAPSLQDATAVAITASGANQQKHITSAQAAGIGVGCAVAGALLAALALFLIARFRGPRRRQGYTQADSRASLPVTQSPDLHPAYSPLPVPATAALAEKTPPPPAAVVMVEEVAPSAVEEQALRQSWYDLERKVKDHVAGMYHDKDLLPSLSPGSLEPALLERLGYNRTSPSDMDILDLLYKADNRSDALVFLMATAICPRLDLSGDEETTLLPPALVQITKSMPETSGTRSQIAAWRSQTMTILADRYPSTVIDRTDPRSAHISALLNLLIPILRPFVEESRATHAFEDLEEILEEAARFGLKIFGSKGEWTFSYETGEKAWKERGAVPGWPGLRRLDVERRLARRSLLL